MTPARSLRVWDPLVRALHWSLVMAVAVTWLSTLRVGIPLAWHEPAGYVAIGCTAMRIVWGVYGTRYARFRQFVRRPSTTLRYAQAVRQGRAPRHIGHNPLGGWMALTLLASTAAIAVSGWLQTTDRYWGSETLEWVHTGLAWSLLGLIFLHVLGVIVTSRHHGENLVLAMLDGRKAPASGNDVA
ncbi:cytochrome b/b6 domain-containing protein [uncultured Aquabacterium sp.]|jgi:cytochrome b|uniref:cytochrome b/b6 domain-containing protein n=1 Tax=uncultured Aquabacterium sp. TaxID=158753 RepID=UPI002635A3BD|nr:cytochrome b/b6 domain-containing protein [uncultured Aquabacterium sp.]